MAVRSTEAERCQRTTPHAPAACIFAVAIRAMTFSRSSSNSWSACRVRIKVASCHFDRGGCHIATKTSRIGGAFPYAQFLPKAFATKDFG